MHCLLHQKQDTSPVRLLPGLVCGCDKLHGTILRGAFSKLPQPVIVHNKNDIILRLFPVILCYPQEADPGRIFPFFISIVNMILSVSNSTPVSQLLCCIGSSKTTCLLLHD